MQAFHICPDTNLPVRVFKLEEDRFGVVLTDLESGLSVTLDWNGEELKAVITAEGQDDPTHVHVLKPNKGN